MILSRIFEKQGRTAIALYFLISLSSPALIIGVTRTTFRSSRKISFSRDKLNTCIKGFRKGSKQFLKTLKLMSS